MDVACFIGGWMLDQGMDKEKVSPALGKIASGLFIATSTDAAGNRIGMLCSFVEQAGFEPPMLTIAIAPDRRLAQALVAGGKLGINVLGQTNGGALMKPFVSSGDGDPFVDLELKENAHGIPQLTNALAFLTCELKNQMPAGDHTIYLCEVIDGEMPANPEKDQPMTRVRNNGFGY
ncbi:MAG: flavin reductase (DIM6/NTAB) family NADH-FMN oxidoreductase RutF [Verrucomicrobiales bacterium]|jgi:flavin reductase (DIM6/NTAB) family NADH-FMN oxidoreductase RutF